MDWTDLAPEDKGRGSCKDNNVHSVWVQCGNCCLAEKILYLQEGLCSMLV